jgi:cell division septal protein FtsQ
MASSGRLPAMLVALVSGLLAFAFLFTFDYPVSEITVEGLTVGDAHDVVDASGMLGEPAFRAELEDAAAGVARLPYVERVEVMLTFPGEATILVTERTPALILAQGAERSLIATTGSVMAESTDARELPVLKVGPGEPAGALPADLVAMIGSIVKMRGTDAELSWTGEDGLILTLPSGQMVIFGETDQPAAKLAVLEAVEEQIDADWEILDLREPTRPAYR